MERRYREIVEQAADIIYTRDMDGRITSINEAGARFFGRPAFELIGQPLGALIGEEFAARDIAAMQNIKSLEPIRFTDCLHNALGELRYLEGIVSLERNSQGEYLGVRGVVRDVTDRHFVEKALRESEARYRVVAETASDAIMTIDESTKILFANPAAEKIFGYQLTEFLVTAIELKTVSSTLPHKLHGRRSASAGFTKTVMKFRWKSRLARFSPTASRA